MREKSIFMWSARATGLREGDGFWKAMEHNGAICVIIRILSAIGACAVD